MVYKKNSLMHLTKEVSYSINQCVGMDCCICLGESLSYNTIFLQSLRKLYAETGMQRFGFGKREDLRDCTYRSKSLLFKDSRSGREEFQYSGQAYLRAALMMILSIKGFFFFIFPCLGSRLLKPIDRCGMMYHLTWWQYSKIQILLYLRNV